MNTIQVIAVARMLAAVVFAVGAIWLASMGKDGWGWCIFAAILISDFSYKSNKKED